MPAPLAIDKELVKQLILEGFSVREVAEKTGVNQLTIRSWKKRGKWLVPNDVNDNVEPTPEELRLQKVAGRLSELAVNESQRILESLAAMGKPKTRGECKTHAQAVLTAYTVGRKALGLDGESGGGSYTLTMISNGLAGAPKPILDVATTLVPGQHDPCSGGVEEQAAKDESVTTPGPGPLTPPTDNPGGEAGS